MGIAIFTFDIFFDNWQDMEACLHIQVPVYTDSSLLFLCDAINPILSTRLVTVSLKFQKLGKKNAGKNATSLE